MKSLSLLALICVLLLAVMFGYVIEDIPAFGDANSPPNKYVKLFSVDAEDSLVSSLNAGVIPPEIKNRTEEIGYTKENNFPTLDEGKYEINRTEGGWDVLVMKDELYYPGPEKFYFIKEEDGRLDIYRYSIPVRWEEKTIEETELPDMVTSGLADYRGYDTMYEETVIFTGALSVILLLRREERL